MPGDDLFCPGLSFDKGVSYVLKRDQQLVPLHVADFLSHVFGQYFCIGSLFGPLKNVDLCISKSA